MRVVSIRIQKFRSIDDATITLEQVMAMVGANNAGKSHVLRALNAFFNFPDEQDSFSNRDHIFSVKSRPKITVVFDGIDADDEIMPRYLFNGRLTIIFTYRWDRLTPSYEVQIGQEKQTIDTDTFSQLISHFKYIYVPVIRDYDSSFARENGIAYRLLRKIIQQQIANRNTVQPLIDKLYDKIGNTVFRTALGKIADFYPFGNKTKFSLTINNRDLADTVLRDVSLMLIEESQSNEISNCGSGIQSAVYFAISLAVSMEDNISYLVGIEEPEQNMHPQAQRQLIESFKSMERYPNTQFILTTHSPVIIDKVGHTAVALCRKAKGKTRDIVTTITQIGHDFWDKYSMQEERYRSFFEYKNSDFFFSNMIVITESSTDCGVIAALLQQYGVDAESIGLSLVPANGEKSVKYPYALAKELSIPFICVVDHDVFQAYTNDKRKDSLDENGIPQYKQAIKSSSPICDLISSADLQELNSLLNHRRYAEALQLLGKYSIVMMRYSLEVDLAICSSYCAAYCDYLDIQGANRNSSYLLIERSSRIKDFDAIAAALMAVPMRNLPASYKRIIQCIKDMVMQR